MPANRATRRLLALLLAACNSSGRSSARPRKHRLLREIDPADPGLALPRVPRFEKTRGRPASRHPRRGDGRRRLWSRDRPRRAGKEPLVTAIHYGNDLQMPPDGKLENEQIAALSNWVKLGAPWPASEQVVRPRRPIATSRLPTRTARSGRSTRSPIRRCRQLKTEHGPVPQSTASSWRSWKPRTSRPRSRPTSAR